MRNLAGDEHCDASIRDELEAAGIEIVEDEPHRGEVPARLAGKLGPFKFRRAWYYWVVDGPTPLVVALELYADAIGKRDVRVGGHCGCPSPREYGTTHYDTDGKILRPIDSDDYRLIQAKPWSAGMAGVLATVEHKCRFVADPPSQASRSIVDSYHIDSSQGLRLFADTVKKHRLA